MFQDRITTVGVECGPKAEMATTSGAYTLQRLYLMPIRVKAHTKFSQYDFQFQVTLAAGTQMQVRVGVYERMGKLNGTTAIGNLVAGTTVNYVVPLTAVMYTIPLGATKNLPPGDYWIGITFQKDGAGAASVISVASHTALTWITGDWIYYDLATFALPQTVLGFAGSAIACGYIHAATQSPFWAALTYIGDVLP